MRRWWNFFGVLGRYVPDVATVVADFKEGVQDLVTATMACQNTPIKQMIRGHFGSLVFGVGEKFDGFDFIPKRPQGTHNSRLKEERIEMAQVNDTTYTHFKNWVDAMVANDPSMCNNDSLLGAAAITTVKLGAQSYRQGKVFFVDDKTLTVSEADSSLGRRLGKTIGRPWQAESCRRLESW